MKRLSSKTTFFYKLFPLLWFGFLTIFFFAGIFSIISKKDSSVIFIVVTIGMVFLGYLMKKIYGDLIDEVYDEGSTLLFRNKGLEFRVNLKDIKNVNYTILANPHRVTLSIRYQTELGDELSFLPPASLIPFKKNEEIVMLIDRIDKARGSA